jgi:acetyl-CoA carboxylase biotin carboxylase subunit
MFHKVLVANRGEIAVRVIRALRELGIGSVAVCSEADKDALHTMLADESICIGPARASESYLDKEQILAAASACGADAIHPGYGFLSENAEFASLCEACQIKFIGPSAEVIRKMGDKAEARRTMMKQGVPVIPGCDDSFTDCGRALEEAVRIGFPVMIKAAAGGGGKGMRIAENAETFQELFRTAQQESLKGFSDNRMYLEKYLRGARHIEFQILADSFGNVIHLGERDCSVQRRHQKLLEECPSPALDEKLRKKMGDTAVRAARAAGYENAGTVEFLLDDAGRFYFMEMNTRIQVEHGITEEITGTDLVKEQIRLAAGEKLDLKQKDVVLSGHAMECRINAENPDKGFMPCPGKITGLHIPGGNGIRVDTAVYQDYAISPFYDSMILKLIVHGKDRTEAIAKMKSALGETVIEGVDTNLDFEYELMNHAAFKSGKFNTDFMETYFPQYLKL